MALRLSLHDSWTPDLVRPWERVLAADPEAGVFATPQWTQAWWETLGTGDLMVGLVWDGDEPIAVVPACRCATEARTLLLLGGEDVTDEQVPLAIPGREIEALEFFLDWAFSDGGFALMRFHSVMAGRRWLQTTEHLVVRRGWPVSTRQVDVAPAITLPASFGDYLAGLDGHHRHELRRKRRRLSDAGKWDVRRAHEVGWEDDLAAFFRFHRRAPGDKAGFFTPERERFFRRLAADLLLFGLARLDVLDLDGEPVAATFSYDFRGQLSLYNSAFDPGLAKLAPGMVLVGCLIEQAISDGHTVFDFLRGDETYKLRFGPVMRPVYRVDVTGPGPV